MYNKGDRDYVDIYVCVIVGTRAQSVVSLTSDHFINFWYLLLLLWWELASIINLTLQIIIRKGIGKPCDCGQLQHFNLNQQWLIFSTCLCISRLFILTTNFQISLKLNFVQINKSSHFIFIKRNERILKRFLEIQIYSHFLNIFWSTLIEILSLVQEYLVDVLAIWAETVIKCFFLTRAQHRTQRIISNHRQYHWNRWETQQAISYY